MNSPVIGLRVPSVIFGLVCLLHLVRLLMQLDVMIGAWHVPVWLSGLGVVATGALGIWLWRLSVPLKAQETQSDRTTPHAPHPAAS